jgi:hypothetical protein
MGKMVNIYNINKSNKKIPSSGMLRHVTLVRTDNSEEHTASIISSMRRFLVTANVVSSSLILVTLMMEVLRSS